MALPDFAGRNSQLDLFRDSLPSKPYCSNDLTTGLRIRSMDTALRYAYIQPNHPNSKLWLVFDIDRPTCVSEITDDCDLPAPHIFVQNPANSHAHAYYGLETPVHLNQDSSLNAIRFAGAVDCAFTVQLDADAQYCGLIAKNPVHKRWRAYSITADSYSLGEMSEYVDLTHYNDRRKHLPETGLGRNVNLFNRLRKWSYQAIRQGWPDFDQWHQACYDRATGYNRTSNPLPVTEVKSTALSVAKWTHKRFTPAAFSELQASRGARKGKQVRDAHMQTVLDMREQGYSLRMIADYIGVNHQTISNWVSKSHIR